MATSRDGMVICQTIDIVVASRFVREIGSTIESHENCFIVLWPDLEERYWSGLKNSAF
ncbi:hypothetical protein RBWH47_02027 [Rhodopirellula baltica WH47]|uniref:Uncharacterized protein n=1 Tax=Rhodopirellula baltica WH47 TaxID=991778 RepID=F2AZU2_RHOBT|nr:hypothetical protein RBWH47_02027 [Rhodopirellula baltica WH47]